MLVRGLVFLKKLNFFYFFPLAKLDMVSLIGEQTYVEPIQRQGYIGFGLATC